MTDTKSKNGWRWVYKLNLYKNTAILFLVMKIFFFVFVGIFAFVCLLNACEDFDGFFWEGFLDLGFGFSCIIAGFMLLAVLGYYLYALIMGGCYCVEFDMDNSGVTHRQVAWQVKRARIIGILLTILGALSRRPTTVGIGTMTGSRSTMRTQFKDVTSIEPQPQRNTIKLHTRFTQNQVYAADEDFDRVLEFISGRVAALSAKQRPRRGKAAAATKSAAPIGKKPKD